MRGWDLRWPPAGRAPWARTLGVSALGTLLLAASLPMAAQSTPPQQTTPLPHIGAELPARTLVEQAYHAAFNLDHELALQLARRAVAIAPDEPAPHRALAAVLWLRILLARGAATVDTYMGSITKSLQSLPKAPAALEAEFTRELGLATSLADARLARAPLDINARYDVGAAYALRATYVASVEGSMSAAFSAARRAYDAHETVFERDPSRSDAAVVVGSYRYLISGLSMPKRLLAYVAGFGGGKDKGIQMLEAAARDRRSLADASLALILIYTREGRHEDALRHLRAMEAAYPANRLLVLERASATLRAGRHAEADAILTQGLDALARDERVKMPGERALWLSKRGAARVALKRTAEAAIDLQEAITWTPLAWVRGRIRIEQGKLDDLAGRRMEALAAYRDGRAICTANNDPIGAAEADRWLKRPYGRAP